MISGLIRKIDASVPADAPPPRPGETPWFRGDVQPVQIGVYRRLSLAKNITVFSLFDGDQWWWSSDTPERAAEAGVTSLVQNLPWCGLALPAPQGYGPVVKGGAR